MADRLEESVNDHPPRPRLQPRLRRRREPRAADPDRRDEDVHVELLQGRPARTRGRAGRVPRLVGAAARPARLARPEPARALEARLRARAARPAPGGRPRDDRVGRRAAARRRRAQGDHASLATVPDRPLRIRHDPPRVGQIVSNLVGNALKFTPPGGEVRVAAHAPSPTAGRGSRSSTRAWASAPDELPWIFDRFYRGAEANEARCTGSGLGLAIVKSIVDMHHGSIAVESRRRRRARGSSCELPRDPRVGGRRGAAASPMPGPSRSRPRRERWTILHRLRPRR